MNFTSVLIIPHPRAIPYLKKCEHTVLSGIIKELVNLSSISDIREKILELFKYQDQQYFKGSETLTVLNKMAYDIERMIDDNTNAYVLALYFFL